VIGGFLSSPVPRLLPSSFTLFSTYPYLLPSLVVGLSGFAAWFTSYIYLPEVRSTVYSTRRHAHTNQTLPPSLRRSSKKDSEKGSRPGTLKLLRYKPFQHVLILYGRKSFPCVYLSTLIHVVANAVQFSFEAIYPLFAFTRKELGGLELRVSLMSYDTCSHAY